MHAAVCLLRAGQPRSAGDTAKLGQFIGQFSWVTGDPIGLKRLIKCAYILFLFTLFRCVIVTAVIEVFISGAANLTSQHQTVRKHFLS